MTAMNEDIFFILSSSRSGSTLLSSMLNMHPSLHIPVELIGLYSRFPSTLKSYGDLRVPRNSRILARDMQTIGQLSEFGIHIDTETLASQLTESGGRLCSVIRAFYKTLLIGTGKSRIGDKTPSNLPFVSRIHAIFPDAKYIHLVRDGRDCALSSMKSRRGINYRNVFELGERWSRDNWSVCRFGKQFPEKYLLISYEDLLKDPESVLKKTCRFLVEPYSDELLRFNEGEFARKNWTLLSHHKNLRNRLIRNNIHKWKTGLSRNEIKTYDSLASKTLEELGYPVTTDLSGTTWKIVKQRYHAATRSREFLRRARAVRKETRRRICVFIKRRWHAKSVSEED